MFPLIYPVVLFTFLPFLSAPALSADMQAVTGDPLDGLKFQGKTGEQGKGDHHLDTITFENGEFRSLDCEEWGFGPAPYQFEIVGDSLTFSAVLPSPDRGTLEWRGRIDGEQAEAEFRWQHKRWYGDIDRRYWFRGTRDRSKSQAP
jgi:hypothetical protein